MNGDGFPNNKISAGIALGYLRIGQHDPTIIATEGGVGALYLMSDISGPQLFQKLDDGETTNWVPFLQGPAAMAWLTTGNSGPGNILGTLTTDDWAFISSSLVRGGFKYTGEFFLKTPPDFPNSEYIFKTGGVTTTDATPQTLFTIPILNPSNVYITVKTQCRQTDGYNHAAFERKVMVLNEGLGPVLSLKVHYTFTDKSNVGYNTNFTTSGNNVLIQVTGANLQTLTWTGVVTYQAATISM